MQIKNLTPMMIQYLNIKSKYKDCILFYRLGDFYEMFFDDAVIASKELDLTLTSRNSKAEEKIPLCGVPFHSSEPYIAKLVNKGYKVAICEQVEDPKKAKGIVKREVIKVITKGTITDEYIQNKKESNFLASIYIKEKYALSYVDLSNMQINTTIFENFNLLYQEIIKINPSELIIEKKDFKLFKEIHTTFTTNVDNHFDFKRADNILKDFRSIYSSIDNTKETIISVGALIQYILQTQLVNNIDKFSINNYSNSLFLSIDNNSIINLELFKTIRTASIKGSLIGIIDKTSTLMGARKLVEWIKKPLIEIDEIKKRNNLVNIFYQNDYLRDKLIDILKKINDIERLISKLLFSNIMPKDIISLNNSLKKAKLLIEELNDIDFSNVVGEIKAFDSLTNHIDKVLKKEPASIIREGNFINKGYNNELDEYLDIIENGSSYLLEIEKKEKEKTGIKNLKIKFNKVFGYFIEVTHANTHLVPDNYIRKQTLTNAERYFTSELKEIEEKILNAKEKRIELEKELYFELVEYIKEYSKEILEVSSSISKLDVLVSFSIIANENNYVLPEFNDKNYIKVKDSRHPVVEALIEENSFIPNDIYLNNNDEQFLIITGPNMAGKSTFLRQIALISILAQIGSFVPATKANLCIVDKLFTRIGASDNLTQNESTFMVEMNELSYIIKNATNNSLVILDEIGRGTSTYDGLSIAWSVVEYFSTVVKPKCIFATHYHELTEIESKYSNISNYMVNIEKIGNDLIFLRKILKGKANKSYGIEVARLAGINDEIINRANEILLSINKHDFSFKDTEIKSEEKINPFENIDVNNLTPIEALILLKKLKDKYDE